MELSFPEFSTETPVIRGAFVKAIAWLGPNNPYQHGSVAEEVLMKIRYFATRWRLSQRELWLPPFRGLITCELCTEPVHARPVGYGVFGVPADNLLFVSPALIFHYLNEHGYCPPDHFVQAVIRSPVPGTRQYRDTVAPFREVMIAKVAPQYFQWVSENTSFPGVGTCIELLHRNSNDTSWRLIVYWLLYAHAADYPVEVIQAFRDEIHPALRLGILKAIADARISAATTLLSETAQSTNIRESRVAIQGLRLLETTESISALQRLGISLTHDLEL